MTACRLASLLGKPASRLALLAVFVCAGCSSAPRATKPPLTDASGAPTPEAAADPNTNALALAPWAFVGRVLSVDEPARTAVIELAGFASPIGPGDELLIRSGALRIVGRLEVLPLRRGRFVAVQVIEGDVRPGDEVVRAR